MIALLRPDKVQVRLFDEGSLHTKAYLFHRDNVGANNRDDRLRPLAAVVRSSNCTGPGLTRNLQLNRAHRVLTAEDETVDREAAQRLSYLREQKHLPVFYAKQNIDT